MEEKEAWKDIVGYEGLYQISNLGRVMGLPNNKKRNYDILKPQISNRGYMRIALWKNSKSRKFLVHRLVALHFLPNFENKTQVNHKNGIKTENNVNNIEWATPSENLKHACLNGLKTQWGESNPISKLSTEQVIEIRRLCGIGYSLTKIAKIYNIAFQTVSDIKNKKTWKKAK